EVRGVLRAAPVAPRPGGERVLRHRHRARRRAQEGRGAVPAARSQRLHRAVLEAHPALAESATMSTVAKISSSWRSERMQREAQLVRWGSFGTPVLIFPTAGGDCEEIERMHLVGALAPLLDAGKIKVYSCDSVSGRAMLMQEGPPAHRMWLQNMFHQYVRHEVVPPIPMDCSSEDIGLLRAGFAIRT